MGAARLFGAAAGLFVLLVALVAAIVFLEISVPRMIASLGGAACAYFVLADVALAAAGRDGGRLGGALHGGLRALVGDAGAWIVLAVAALAITVAITGVSLKKIIGWTIVRLAALRPPAKPAPKGKPKAPAAKPPPKPLGEALREALHLPAVLPRAAAPAAAGANLAVAAPPPPAAAVPVPTHTVVEPAPPARFYDEEVDEYVLVDDEELDDEDDEYELIDEDDDAALIEADDEADDEPGVPVAVGEAVPAGLEVDAVPVTAALAVSGEYEAEPPPQYRLPVIERIFDAPQAQINDEASRAMLLEDTLASFGVSAKVVHTQRGPSITRYELKPDRGVKIASISSLSHDLALALAATSVRIEAPIPGKSAVGIEVPNTTVSIVALREILQSIPEGIALPMALGKDITGRPVVGDLAKMPHLLVAGATGAGKSVCLNCVIASLLVSKTPDEVEMLMIDPKRVELTMYNGIPHLKHEVITDPSLAAGALAMITREMDQRYERFQRSGVRKIEEYNAKHPTEKLPYIVVVIDELADLMLIAPAKVEMLIMRLAQLARATGIHLIVATQRPSVDVITGLIKANIPSRIAFAVSSQVDSRTILDMGGAERLLGRGDMLYLADRRAEAHPRPRRAGQRARDRKARPALEAPGEPRGAQGDGDHADPRGRRARDRRGAQDRRPLVRRGQVLARLEGRQGRTGRRLHRRAASALLDRPPARGALDEAARRVRDRRPQRGYEAPQRDHRIARRPRAPRRPLRPPRPNRSLRRMTGTETGSEARSAIIRFIGIALVAAILYTGLGLAVSHVPPFGIDLAGRALAIGPEHLAYVFTESCYWYVLTVYGIAGIVLAVFARRWRARVIYTIVTMLATWQLSNLLKNVFGRPRPEYWRLIHEPTYSYSSGHAMFALVVYGLWAWFVWKSDLPRPVRAVLAPLLALWACGVIWSRLALGAHYVTDLIGGVLLGTLMLALAAAIRSAIEARRSAASAPIAR